MMAPGKRGGGKDLDMKKKRGEVGEEKKKGWFHAIIKGKGEKGALEMGRRKGGQQAEYNPIPARKPEGKGFCLA